VCSIHGPFWQLPHNHLNGSGCPKCACYISKPESEFLDFLMSNRIFYFNVSDKFTFHGIVGVILIKENTLEQIVMSCRVIGLTVEFGVLKTIFQYLNNTHNISLLKAKFIDTDSNNAATDFYHDFGFKLQRLDDKGVKELTLKLDEINPFEVFGGYSFIS
jgi:predicted enzyme involved in methoxymalonyl-ACP biosynthesis